MQWQITPESLLLVFSSVIVSVVAGGLWWKRNAPGAKCLLGMMVASAIWCLASAIEYAAIAPEARIFASKLQYIGIYTLIPAYVMFGLGLSHIKRRVTRGFQILLWGIPVITVLLAFTNEFHGLIWTDITPLPDSYGLVYHHGLGFWLGTTFSYICLIAGSWLVVYAARNRLAASRAQTSVILIAVSAPWVANILYLTGLFPVVGIDPTPFAFAVSGILFAFSIYQFQIFNITPIARDKVVDTMDDLLIVIDSQSQIVDLNPAAAKTLQVKRETAIGHPSSELLTNWPHLVYLFTGKFEEKTVIKTVQDKDGLWYSLRISPIQNRHEQLTGWMILLRDVTDQKKQEEENRKLASIIEEASEAIVLTDTDGNILYVNPFFRELTGYEIEETLGKSFHIFTGKQRDDAYYNDLSNTVLSGKAWRGNFINKHKDGSPYHEAATVFPIKNAQGVITNYAAVTRDISAQIKAEEALRDFSQRLAKLSEISIQLTEADGVDEACRLAVELGHRELGFDRMGIWFVDLEDPEMLCGSYGIDEHGQIRDERCQRLEITPEVSRDVLLSPKDRVFYRENVSLTNDRAETIGYGDLAIVSMWDTQKAIGFIAIDNLLSQHPITPDTRELLNIFAQVFGALIIQKQIGEAIQESEQRYRLLADNVTDVIWTMDMEGRFTYFSPSVERLSGHTPKEIIGISLEKVLTPASLEIAQSTLASIFTALQAGQKLVDIPTVELEQRRKDWSTVWVEVTVNIMYGDNGEALGILGLTREITERKQAQEKVRQTASQQQLLNEITYTAIRQSDYREMAQILADRLGELFDADGCYITFWDETNQLARPLTAYGPLQDTYRSMDLPKPDEPTLTKSVLNLGKPLAIPDVFNTPYLSPKIAAQFPAKSQLALPLIANDQKLGAALIAFNHSHEFSEEEIILGEQAANQIALALLKARLLDEAEYLAIHDALTGLLNRRHFMEMARKEFSRAQRYHFPLSVIMFDIDHFKLVNDTYGHPVGDQVLQMVAQKCLDSTRSSDIVGRYGGEEFIILLPETPTWQAEGSELETSSLALEDLPAKSVAARLRRIIEKASSKTSDDVTVNVTISLGIAEMDDDCPDVEHLINQADQALLEAKQNGRNQVVIWNKK